MRVDRDAVLIVAALPAELAPLRRRLGAQRGPDRTWQARGGRVVLAVTGMGGAAARQRAARLLERTGARALLGLGVAGAVSPELGVGDAIVATAVSGEAGEAPAPHRGWARAMATAGGARCGVVWSTHRPLWSAAAKAAVEPRCGAGPVVADLESFGWATAAAARGVPYAVVRVVSDGPREDLPDVLAAAWAGDRVRFLGLLAGLARRPRSVVGLLELRGRVRAAARRLAELAERGLEAAPAPEGGA